MKGPVAAREGITDGSTMEVLMVRRLWPALVAVIALLAATFVATSASHANGSARSVAAGPAYLSIMFGRAQWAQVAPDCTVAPGAVPMDRIAADLRARGMSGVANVVLARTQETSRQCYHRYALHPSWVDLAMLRDTYGWDFISAGRTYTDMTTLTPDQQRVESCGSLPDFAAHGHDRAWGMFAYPKNNRTATIQTDVVSTCFAFGRTYSGGPTARPGQAPWFQGTTSVNGGHCNMPTAPCASIPTHSRFAYVDPAALVRKARPGPDQWGAIQWYRLVEGAHTAGAFSWDCTSPDWRLHWVSDSELYCYGDFLSVVGSVPPGVVVTDPATVATAWGRIP